MPEKVITLERPALIYDEEVDCLFVDLFSFQIKFHKGTAGYDEIWKDGKQVVADVRWLLQDSKGKQIGIPQRIEWEEVDQYTLRVKRFYTDYLGTDFTVIYECHSDDRIKITVEGVVGKSDAFNLIWSGSGIASASVNHDKDIKQFSCFDEDIERPDVAFDYEDVYKQLGDITTVEVSGRAGGRKADFSFGIGSLAAGEQFRVDPTLITTSEFCATSYNSQRKLVRSSDGTLYAVYVKLYAGYTQIHVKKSTDDGASWTAETRISNYSGMATQHQDDPSIAVDSSGHLHVVWYGKATGYTVFEQLWYRKYTDSWGTVTRISTSAGMETRGQRDGTIAVDSSDYLHVVWHGVDTEYPDYMQIFYAKYTDSWATPVRISTLEGSEERSQFSPSIAVDSNDYLHVVWQGQTTVYSDHQIWYAKYTDSWATPVRISTYAGMGSYEQEIPSIAVDSDDCLHVVWDGWATGYTTVRQIWYAKYTDSWATPVRISTYAGMESQHQYFPSIAVDSSDYLHVLWHGKATGYIDEVKVWYAKYETSWVEPECLQATGRNQFPNARWSRYPASNIPYAGVDYFFAEGTSVPFNIYWDKVGAPFPPFDEKGREQVILAAIGESNLATWEEIGKVQTVLAAQGVVDKAVFDDKGKEQTVLVVVVGDAGKVIGSIYIVKTGTLADSISSNNARKLARKSDGELWCTYTRHNGVATQVFCAYSTDDGENWTEEQITNQTSGNHQYRPAIAIDSDDNVHVIWAGLGWGNNPTKQNLQYRKRTTSWQAPETVTDIDDDQHSPSIAIDSNDDIHIAWHGYGWGSNSGYDNIQYRKRTTYWHPQEGVTDKDAGQDSVSITIDSDDNVHVVWMGYGWGENPTKNNVQYRKRTTFWLTREAITDVAFNQAQPSMAIDPDDNIHVAWAGLGWGAETGNYNIQYRKRTTSWQAQEALTDVAYTQESPSLAIDASNYLHVAWAGEGWGLNPTDYNIQYRKRTDSWQAQATITDRAYPQYYPNLIWASYPSSNSVKTNRPKTGCALVWAGQIVTGYQVEYLCSDDLTWGVWPVTYDETRRIQTILAAHGRSDLTTFFEKSKTQVVLAGQGGNAWRLYDETSRSQAILAVLEEVEQLIKVETREQVILVAQGEVEQLIHVEAREQIILAAQGREDVFISFYAVYDETGRLQVILAVQGRSDLATFLDVREQIVLVTHGKSDLATWQELGKLTVVLAAQGEGDVATFVSAREQIILAAQGRTDTYYIAPPVFVPLPFAYVVEIRNGDGALVAMLENASEIGYVQTANVPHSLRFSLPSDDEKLVNIILANQLWLRDRKTDEIVRKFQLQRKMDVRQ